MGMAVPRAQRTTGFAICSLSRLDIASISGDQVRDQADHEDRQKDEEQHLREAVRSDSAKAKEPSKQRDDKGD